MQDGTCVSRRKLLQGIIATGTIAAWGDVGDSVPAVRFGFITDCHYAAHLKPSLSRNYADGLVKMEAFAAKMNALGVDFVVEGGDFKDLGRSREESLAYLRDIEGRFAAFKGPRYHVLGNHDHDNLSKEEFLAEVANEGQPSVLFVRPQRDHVHRAGRLLPPRRRAVLPRQVLVEEGVHPR